MKAYFKKIAALTAAALLVLSMAACGGNDDTESTAPVDDTNLVVEEIPADDTNASDEDTSAESESPSEETNTSETAKNEEDATKATSTASDTLSKEEAVALFNKATAGASSKSGNRYTKVDLVDVPGGDTTRKILDLANVLPDPNAATALKGVPNGTMNASDFSSVTAKKSGNNWVLTLNVKSETAPNHPANTRAFAELPQNEIDNAIGKIKIDPADGIKFIYSGGKIEATVTADGKLVSATYTMKVEVSVGKVKVGGFFPINSAKVAVTQTDKF